MKYIDRLKNNNGVLYTSIPKKYVDSMRLNEKDEVIIDIKKKKNKEETK